MKLYTKEQVKLMIDDAHNGVDGYYDILKKHKPIELPSDEEIVQWAKKQSEIEPTGAEEFGRIYGAKWMRDKIQGGNNEQQ